MNIVAVQLGARMYYAVPRILHRAGLLERFHTDLLGDRGWPRALRVAPQAWLPPGARRLLSRRLLDVPSSRVTTHPRVALQMEWALRRARNPLDVGRACIRAGDEICRRVVSRGIGSAEAVFVVGSSSRILFEEARRLGKRTVMESIIAAPAIEEALMGEEARRFPAWAVGAPAVRAADFADLVREEWSLADLIVCGSEFVRESIRLAGGPVGRCAVVPYGLVQTVEPQPRQLTAGRPLRVLTVGAIGLRKGSPYVAAAAQRLRGRVEFRMVGEPPRDARVRAELAAGVSLTGAVPRDQVAAHYAWADVFLLPSLCEGSATVIFEALGHGLPVVTTPNSGSVIAPSRDGFLVPIRDVAGIVAALEKLAGDRNAYAAMSAAAIETARTYSFDRYAERLVAALQTIGLGKDGYGAETVAAAPLGGRS